MKVFYIEKYKILLKEIREGTNEKIPPVHGSEGFVLLKCPYYSKVSTD